MRRLLCLGIVLAFSLALVSGAGSARKGPARLAAYRGLGTWVDLYDPRSWAAPETAVDAMAQHGVRTLFLETGNYSHASRVYKPDYAARFIEAAHANGMRVVAWYLPDFAHPRHDFLRSLGAIRFRAPDGERFDSFSLDIESSVVQNVQLRNARMLDLSRRLRSAVGRSYPLGAIIPPPRGIHLLPS